MKNKKQNKKHIFALILLIFFAVNILAAVAPFLFVKAAGDEIKIYLDEKEIKSDAEPYILKSRVLVPVRLIFESLEAEVEWNGKENKVTVINKDKEINFKIDSNIAYINGKKYTLDVEAKLKNSRTYIPLRFLAENFDMKVEWSDAKRSVYITRPKKEETDYIKLIDISLFKDKIEAKFDKEKIEYKEFMLENPDRLVIDISDCVNTVKAAEYKETKFYSAFRAAQFSVEPMTSRMVIELSEYEYKISFDKKVLTVDFSGKDEKEPDKEPEKEPEIDDDIIYKEKKKNPKFKTVVIDAGHGGNDPGAVGQEGDKILIKEKDPNLDIALKVYSLLAKEDVNVYMTRSKDVFLELSEIAEFANSKEADLFVSIHNNASENTSVSGTMTMYAYDEPKENHTLSGKAFATIMQKYLVKATKAYDFGPTKNSSLYVVRKTTMPAVITESLFVTNKDDRTKLLDEAYIDAIAKAIYKGIMEALEVIE